MPKSTAKYATIGAKGQNTNHKIPANKAIHKEQKLY